MAIPRFNPGLQYHLARIPQKIAGRRGRLVGEWITAVSGTSDFRRVEPDNPHPTPILEG
jgi:hypothetical protein